jgi:LysR family transcriptional activator of nhaA
MEHLNYHHLLYFWTVCREGGFTKAGIKLRLSQSAVSEQVSRLEESLGQKLILRTTRRFELTEVGRATLKYANTIFSTGEELMDFIKHRPNLSKQMIRIGALGSLSRNVQAAFLKPLLDRNDVHFSVTVGDSKRLLRLLRDHALDVVLSTYPAGEEEQGELYTHRLSHSPLCVIGAPKVFRRPLTHIHKMLESHRVFLLGSAMESRSDFDHYVESNHLNLNIAGEIDDVALLRILALTGKGLVVIPKFGVASDIRNKSIKVLHEFKDISQSFYAITRQKKFPNPLIGLLVREFEF